MTRHPRLGASLSEIGTVFRGVRKNQRSGTNDCSVGNSNFVTDSRIDADEAVATNLDVARYDSVRGDETIVTDINVMTDKTTAPYNDVVSKGHKGLQQIPLHYEAILSNLEVGPN